MAPVLYAILLVFFCLLVHVNLSDIDTEHTGANVLFSVKGTEMMSF